MSPWGIGEIYAIVPVLLVLVWTRKRLETDGADVPEFEAWCRTDRPVLFALRCREGYLADLVAALQVHLGKKREVVTHRGRFPWTRHVLSLVIEVDRGRRVVWGRVTRARIRRTIEQRPELSGIIDTVTASFGDRLEAIWLQAELAPRDTAAGADRRTRGWAAEVDAGQLTAFTRTHGLPTWASEHTPR